MFWPLKLNLQIIIYISLSELAAMMIISKCLINQNKLF